MYQSYPSATDTPDQTQDHTDPNSARARQYETLHRQLERLQRNASRLAQACDDTADSVRSTQVLGTIHASLFMASSTVLSNPPMETSAPEEEGREKGAA
ncbi:hypothetical protein BJ684DRAFT_20643 [Piptocephalis cylindrospora]|uniref:DASH complex subunit Hsk3 like-domain-containing protein n=1 Tax=Piptocephalis cylindrospora TaxID=1907219 RepID=A0A4P9Y2M1_9FUNG|nr:hypothetical protein BJ684DRAFT_20643 [Piptocephalis cylindrospora]|eukprot:RKP12832.1 hypothetical protein BJ684DRAFT_20643 [Piptocephalis cylindrospora]